MKWRLFFQIVILLFIAGIIFYFVYPKYYFNLGGVSALVRGNKITGELMSFQKGSDDVKPEWKSVR